MKHVYPPRHPASLDAGGSNTSVARGQASEPSLPHEHDESSHSQAGATPQQEEVGRQAYRNATDGTADTDLGPVADQVYNDQVAPERGPARTRR